MKKFHTLEVAEITRETADAVSILFAVPREETDEFTYVQGQHISLKADVEGEELRRTYSICAAVQDRELRIAVKQIPEGRFSTFCNRQLKEGDRIEVFPPAGKFYTPLDPEQARNYVAFAGGSGITPVISLIDTTLRTEPASRFTLFYGNRDDASIIFLERLARLKDRFMDRLEIYHILERGAQDIPLFKGMMDAEKTKALLAAFVDTANADAFFICGPTPMMDAVESVLQEAGVDDECIHIERFVSAGDPVPLPAAPATSASTEKSANMVAEITAIIDGTERQFYFCEGQDNILDSARESGLDVPFSCKGGVCATCRALVREGSADMRLNYGLEPDEVASGYILTCQSRPTSEKLTLSYDE